MEEPSELDDEKLVNQFKMRYQLLENIDCLGYEEVQYYRALRKELENRGFRIEPRVEVINEWDP